MIHTHTKNQDQKLQWKQKDGQTDGQSRLHYLLANVVVNNYQVGLQKVTV